MVLKSAQIFIFLQSKKVPKNTPVSQSCTVLIFRLLTRTMSFVTQAQGNTLNKGDRRLSPKIFGQLSDFWTAQQFFWACQQSPKMNLLCPINVSLPKKQGAAAPLRPSIFFAYALSQVCFQILLETKRTPQSHETQMPYMAF